MTRKGGLTLFFAAALLLAFGARAQDGETRALELEGGKSVAYVVYRLAPDAHLARPLGTLTPSSALNTAKLLNLHLSTGDIEEASLLSNAPKRRFEVLSEYRQSVGEEEFKRVFAQYFFPENRLVAEIAMDRHRLLIWALKNPGADAPPQLAGQFYVEVDGKYLMDDVPSEARANLRRVLEAYRAGKIGP